MRDDTRADLFDLSVLQNEIHRRASAAGLSCQFVDGLSTPHYDWKNKVIRVPRVKLPASTEDLDYMRGAIIHEIGHSNRVEVVARTDKAKIDMAKPFGQLLNIVEDGAMEREIAGTWYGDAVSLGTQHDIHTRRQLDGLAKIKADGKLGEIPEESARLASAAVLGERYRNWDRWSQGSRDRLDRELPKEWIERTNELDKEGFGKRMALAQTAGEVFNIAKDLYKKLFPEDDKDPESPESDQNRQGESGEGKEDPKPGEGEEGESADGESKPSGGKKASEKGKPKAIPWSLLTSDHANEGKPDPNAKVDYSDHHYCRPGSTAGLFLPTSVHKSRTGPTKAPPVPSMVGQLRILLQSQSKNKFEFGLTSGKLDQRKLARLALPVVPGSDSWNKVFKKRIPGRKINTAVQILVDGSGSMSGRKNTIASDAADMLVQAFAGPLRIKTAVHAFDATGHNNRIWPIKEFNENVQPGVVAGRSRGVGFGGNADGDAVMWGLNNIIHRPEHRKIMIVLSDGMPTDGSWVVDPGSMLKYAVAAARNRGVQVYGIGIEDSSVRGFYGADCKVINRADELPKAILDTLKTRV